MKPVNEAIRLGLEWLAAAGSYLLAMTDCSSRDGESNPYLRGELYLAVKGSWRRLPPPGPLQRQTGKPYEWEQVCEWAAVGAGITSLSIFTDYRLCVGWYIWTL
jgi:hypothetical protein